MDEQKRKRKRQRVAITEPLDRAREQSFTRNWKGQFESRGGLDQFEAWLLKLGVAGINGKMTRAKLVARFNEEHPDLAKVVLQSTHHRIVSKGGTNVWERLADRGILALRSAPPALQSLNASKCEQCGRGHTGTYATGRFCSASCARRFSIIQYHNHKKLRTRTLDLPSCPSLLPPSPSPSPH